MVLFLFVADDVGLGGGGAAAGRRCGGGGGSVCVCVFVCTRAGAFFVVVVFDAFRSKLLKFVHIASQQRKESNTTENDSAAYISLTFAPHSKLHFSIEAPIEVFF